ncbi:hypothetical protein L596_010113 [Steinernema carpocapsae]|uniref:Uncharacterized protein n=1 Tax=Steinernema carpocapsae TaxID=34508 RepID=A0A4U5PHE2_STECR|nr:hypothetical protein L596_010113 [Steinernema carpocapsae]
MANSTNTTLHIIEFPRYLQLFLSIDHYLAAACGAILNVVIVVGLSLERSKVLGNYRWFLMAHTVNDLVSTISCGILEMVRTKP